MHSVQSRRDDDRGGAFVWIGPFMIVVFILVLSWAGLFIVVRDLITVASSASATAEAVHE